MIWALLFALIFGGSDSALLNPKSKKHVKRHVEQKETRKEIIDIINNYEKDAKKFNRVKKKWRKEMYQMNFNRSVTREDFKEFFSAYMIERKSLETHALEGGIKVREMLSDKEWALIIKDAESDYLKMVGKDEKYIRRLQKAFGKVEKAIDKNISEEDRKARAMNVIQDYEDAAIKIRKEYNDFNYKENEVLRNRNASREELQSNQSTINILLWKLFDVYITTHVDMVDITTEEEWNKIHKSINKIF